MFRFFLYYVLLCIIQCQPIHEKRSLKITTKEILEINNIVQELKAFISGLAKKNEEFRIEHIKLYVHRKTNFKTNNEDLVLEVLIDEDPNMKNDIDDQEINIQNHENINHFNKEHPNNYKENHSEINEINPFIIENDIHAKKSDINAKSNRKMMGNQFNHNDLTDIKEINDDTLKNHSYMKEINPFVIENDILAKESDINTKSNRKMMGNQFIRNESTDINRVNDDTVKNHSEMKEINPFNIENDIHAMKSDMNTKAIREMIGNHFVRNDLVDIKGVNDITMKKLLDIIDNALHKYEGKSRDKPIEKHDYHDDTIAKLYDTMAKPLETIAKPHDTGKLHDLMAEQYDILAKPHDKMPKPNDSNLNEDDFDNSIMNYMKNAKNDDFQQRDVSEILKMTAPYLYKYL